MTLYLQPDSEERKEEFVVGEILAIISGDRLWSPQDVAQKNEQEFVVGEILAHRGNHQRRSTMEFLVRWTGYDEASNRLEAI